MAYPGRIELHLANPTPFLDYYFLLQQPSRFSNEFEGRLVECTGQLEQKNGDVPDYPADSVCHPPLLDP